MFNLRLLSLGTNQWPSARLAPSVFLNLGHAKSYFFCLSLKDFALAIILDVLHMFD